MWQGSVNALVSRKPRQHTSLSISTVPSNKEAVQHVKDIDRRTSQFSQYQVKDRDRRTSQTVTLGGRETKWTKISWLQNRGKVCVLYEPKHRNYWLRRRAKCGSRPRHKDMEQTSGAFGPVNGTMKRNGEKKMYRFPPPMSGMVRILRSEFTKCCSHCTSSLAAKSSMAEPQVCFPTVLKRKLQRNK